MHKTRRLPLPHLSLLPAPHGKWPLRMRARQPAQKRAGEERPVEDRRAGVTCDREEGGEYERHEDGVGGVLELCEGGLEVATEEGAEEELAEEGG